MSLETARTIDRRFPVLLQQNVVYTVFQYLEKLKAALEREGRTVFFVGKTSGEGQFVPPGFTARWVTGSDGVQHYITGVSHDALWVDGKQYDTAARANDSDEPITFPDGSHMSAEPAWNEIPERFWRPNNPKITLGDPDEPPPPPPPPQPSVLSKGEAYAALQALNAFYQAPEGLQRPGGLVIPDSEGRSVADMQAIAQWFYQLVIERVSIENVFDQIRASHEWKAKHP